MAKYKTVRGRVNDVLKERLQSYIKNENRRGRSIDESSVIRDALVEYMDREEQRLPLPWKKDRMNETDAEAPPQPESPDEAAARKALDPSRHAEISTTPEPPSSPPATPAPSGPGSEPSRRIEHTVRQRANQLKNKK